MCLSTHKLVALAFTANAVDVTNFDLVSAIGLGVKFVTVLLLLFTSQQTISTI